MDNYITHIIVPNVVDNEYIDLAYPVDNKNVINVLCGPNNSGKSFILRTVLKLLETKNYNNNFNIWGYSLMCLNNSMIKSILLRPTDFKQNVGFLSKTKNLNKLW